MNTRLEELQWKIRRSPASYIQLDINFLMSLERQIVIEDEPSPTEKNLYAGILCLMSLLLAELISRRIPLSRTMQEYYDGIVQNDKMLLDHMHKMKQEESILSPEYINLDVCKILKIDELPTWGEIYELKQYHHHEQNELLEERKYSYKIIQYNKLIEELNTSLVGYQNSGRINWWGRIFGADPKHKGLAGTLIEEINKLNSLQDDPEIKLQKMRNYLSLQVLELEKQESKRLLPIVNDLIQKIDNFSVSPSPPRKHRK